jgi:lipopolysaccharide export system permease protein
MDRYIVTQLLMPFLFGVGAFSSIILAVGSLFDLVRQVAEAGLPLTIAIEVMALKLPQYIVFAFPMSILLSGMMTYGSFSASSEIIAFRSCGISIYRLILPALMMSFVVTGITFFFNEMLVPAASQRATTTLTRALKQDKPTFNTDNIVKPIFQEVERDGKKEQVLSWLFYAEKFDGKTMTGLTILDRSQIDKGFSQIINARSAIFDTNKNTWDFEKGTIYLIAPDASYRNIVTFEHQQLQLPKSPFEFAAPDKNLDDMSVAESIVYLETVKLSGDRKKMVNVAVAIQRKLALPFVCIVFSLMGAAMGIRPQRSGKATSFGVSVLLIFGYYLLMFVCAALGQAEIISPFLAGWLPNFIGLAIGGWAIAQVAK